MSTFAWVEKLRTEIDNGHIAGDDHVHVIAWLLQHRLRGHPDESDAIRTAKVLSAWKYLCTKETFLLYNSDTQELATDFTQWVPEVLRVIRLVMHNCQCGPLDTRNY